MKKSPVKIMSMERQNLLKQYIAVARGIQVGAFFFMAFNHWLWNEWVGAWWFIGLAVLVQMYIITVQTRIRRSRKLFVKLYGYQQPKTESLYF